MIYDYIKFHIGLYIATPAALSIIADGYNVKRETCFVVCLTFAMLIFLIAGCHAGLFMSRHVLQPWQSGYLLSFQSEAFSRQRKNMHHSLYWIGLFIGIVGIILSVFLKDSGSSIPLSTLPTTQSPGFMLKDYATSISILITSLLALWVTWKYNDLQMKFHADEFSHQKNMQQKEAHSALRLKAVDLHESFWDSATLGKAREMISNDSEYKRLAQVLSKRISTTECDLASEEYALLEIIDRFYSAIMRLRSLELTLSSFGDDPQSVKMIRDCYGYWVAILDPLDDEAGERKILREYINRFWPGIVGCLPEGIIYDSLVNGVRNSKE